MMNRCIGCYYYDSKEDVCTHGSPIFLDDTCTDYQDNEFVKQIRADTIEECARAIEYSKTIYENHRTETIMRTKDRCIVIIRNLKGQKR